MAPRVQEPRTVAEAQAYIGRDFKKFFAETQSEYAGKVVDIDTEVENDQGLEEVGLFYRVEYEDGDTEHLLWDELAQLLASNEGKGKKRKSTDKPGGGANTTAKPHAGQHQPASSTKRRRQAAQQQADAADNATEDVDTGEEAPDSADADYETAASTVNRKRGRGNQQLPDSSARNNSRRQVRNQHSPATASPEELRGLDNDAAAGIDHGDEAEVDEELEREMEEMEEYDDATVDRLLRENNNEVVNVRQQGLAGHIKAVQVQNFMCHQNFAIDFGTHVNVISGSNGSGKSAVLQAIQNCLGVKAKDTGRGENMKDFVRTGCHESKVQVTIWNTGDDAYRPREFGNSITVERTIKIGGARETASSKIRLLSSTNKVVSTKMVDLHNMLDHLNIDASNPLAVMTQDTSRDFLCGSVADKKKYDLFMKATMLADMQDNLRKAQGYVEQMKSIISELKEAHMKRKGRVKEVRDKLKKLEESAGLLQHRTMYERAVCWAGVESIAEQLKQVKDQVEVVKPKQRYGVDQLLEEVERELELLRQQEETLTADAEAQQATQQNFAATMQQLGDDLKRARLEQRQKNQAFQKLANKLQQAQSELKTLLESTRETNDDRQREFEQKMQAHQQQVAELQQRMQTAEARVQQCEQRQQELRVQHDEKERQLREVQMRQQGVETELQGHQQHLQQLQNAKGQKLAMFGLHGALRTQVDRSKRSFERMPVGPLGAHLTLSDQSWAIAAEVVLGGHLETWIVHNSRDEQTLRRVAQNLRLDRLNVILASFDRPPYNLSSKPGLAPGWHSLRQFVRVEHPTCAHIIDNKLMDLTRYDAVVVDQDEGRCKAVVYNNAAGPAAASAVHIQGRQFSKVRKAVVTKNYFGDRQPRIGQSVESSVQYLQQQIATLQVQYSSYQGQLVTLNGEVQQLRREGEDAMRASRVANGDKLRAQAALNSLQAQIPVLDPIDEEGADNLFAEQQRALREQIATLQISHDRAKTELDQAHLRYEQAKQLMEDRKQEMDEAVSQATGITEELDKLADSKAKQQRHKEMGLQKRQELEAEIVQLQKRLEQLSQELEQCKNEALKACDEEAGVQALADARASIKQELVDKMQHRIEQGHPSVAGLRDEQVQELINKAYNEQCNKAYAVFNRKVQLIEKKIASVEEDAGGSREELEHQLSLAEAEYNRHSKSYHKCKRIYEVTSAAVSKRWNKYYDLFDSVTSTVSSKFMAYMHRRGHAGKVRVSSDDKELRLLVKINSQSAGAADRNKVKAVKDLKQLSGGERSFTTVAFILALGEFTESPFRAMDEFDVFMDAINRRIATQTLLQFARDKGHLQFVLLTPQDLQAVEDAKRMLAEGPDAKPLPEGFVKVVQMRPPRPNQQQQ